jgi:hypothetical protein
MVEEGREPEKGDIDEARRRVLWQALMGGPVILTLSSRPAWASNYHYGPPPGCDPPPKKDDEHDCNPND